RVQRPSGRRSARWTPAHRPCSGVTICVRVSHMDSCGEGRWAGWGDPGRAVQLPEPLRPLLPALGVRAGLPRVELAEVVLAPSRLSPAAEAALVKAVGAEHVRTDTESRARHSAGKSTPDLVRQRAGQPPDPPD